MTMTMLFFRYVALMKHLYIFTIEQRANLFSVLSMIYKTPHRYIPKYHQQPETPEHPIKQYQHSLKLSKHSLWFSGMFWRALVVWGGGGGDVIPFLSNKLLQHSPKHPLKLYIKRFGYDWGVWGY